MTSSQNLARYQPTYQKAWRGQWKTGGCVEQTAGEGADVKSFMRRGKFCSKWVVRMIEYIGSFAKSEGAEFESS